MTKDKKELLINCLKKYKRNVARLGLLQNSLLFDEEVDILSSAIDYSRDQVQTSNINGIDKFLEDKESKREDEIAQLKKDIDRVEYVLEALKDKDRKVVERTYVLKEPGLKVASDLGYTELRSMYTYRSQVISNIVKELL